MKSVPYKCRFGHITIKSFHYQEETKGTVECDECRKFVGDEINTKAHAIKYNYNVSIVRRGEKAVRI